MDEVKKDPKRYVPGNDAEFLSNVTRPTWDNPADSPGLNSNVTKRYTLYTENGEPVLDAEGNPKTVSETLLNIYGIFKQDWRFGNIDKNETDYIVEHIDLAHDLLQGKYQDSSLMCMERGISIVETSHSKRGWFRKLMITLRNENYHEALEPQGSLWKGGKGGNN